MRTRSARGRLNVCRKAEAERASPYDGEGVRTAMREFQPDVLLCAGPGNSLRAPVGHCVLAEGWRGVHDKQALFAAGLIATE